MNLASTRRNWPTGRGFERFYGFLGAETDQWYPDLVYDNHPVDQPFFLYYAPGAAHAPHHAPREWIDRYAGKFDMGYDAVREQTLARQTQEGIVPQDTELPPPNPIGTPGARTGPGGLPFPAVDYTKPWDTLSAEERRLFARMAEVYAGFLSHADHHIGRLLAYLEEAGQLENTLVIVVSDNGASGEGGPDGSVNENKLFNGIPDDLQANLEMIDELGGQNTYNHYPTGWAVVARPRRRDPAPVPPRRRHRAHDPGLPRRRCPGHDQGPHAEPFRRGQHAVQLRRPIGPVGAEDPVLLDARVTGDLARRVEGLCIGRDGGAAVTDDYPGERPYRFTGGAIKRVVIDVSGEPYLDLEREVAAILARE